jgi:hypothetical protein
VDRRVDRETVPEIGGTLGQPGKVIRFSLSNHQGIMMAVMCGFGKIYRGKIQAGGTIPGKKDRV